MHNVKLEGTILKPNMIVPGKNAAFQAAPEEVAELTLRCLRSTVPAAVPGIAFLSGGLVTVIAAASVVLGQRGCGPPRATPLSRKRSLMSKMLSARACRHLHAF